MPTGIVTFLFSDIEGSTRLLQQLGDDYRRLVERHATVMREAIASAGGTEIGTEGDSFFVVFPSPQAAVRAAVDAQRALAAGEWPSGVPVRVRMGLHTGEGRRGGDSYVGLDVHRAARIAAAGHGGQVVVSDETRALTERSLPNGVTLRDLGEHRLKDLERTERIHQLVIEGLPSDFPALRSLSARPNNLPQPLTSLVGRKREMAEVRELITHQRPVTLTGAGGSGKTRLAVALAHELLAQFADGGFFVALDAVREPELVASVIAHTLGITETKDASPLQALSAYVADRELLLVLDNFEQVTDAAPVVEAVLAAAPRLRLLVTSRVPLHLYGEQQYRVPTLPLPDLDRRPPLPELERYAAVRLFVDRARNARAGFSLTEDNAAAIAEITYRLDGLPLAIELAAARSNLLTPQATLKRLDHRLAVLSSTLSGLPPRQRSLRAAIAWSHEQLAEAERTLFRRLAVFAGGCTIEAAESVCNPDGAIGADLLDALSALVDGSLLRQEEGPDGDTRFRFLETIREYALERLSESRELERFFRRHAEHMAAIATEAERQLVASDHLAWLARLTAEHDNVRAALRWAAADGDTQLGLRTAAALWRFWQMRAHLREGREWLARLLAKSDASSERSLQAAAVTAAGNLAYWQADMAAASDHYQRALALDRDAGAPRSIANDLRNLGFIAMARGDNERACELFRESLTRFEQVGDAFEVAEAQASLGAAEMLRGGDLELARRLLSQALSVTLERGMLPRAADNAIVLASVCTRRGEIDAAVGYARQGLELIAGLQDPIRVPFGLDTVAALFMALGHADAAARLAGAAAQLRESIGGSVPAFIEDLDALTAAARAALGDEDFDRLASDGARLDAEAALATALDTLAGPSHVRQ